MKKIKFIFNTLLPSIRFNFHYLPFKQAMHLPIYICKPQYENLLGSVVITAPNLRRGMIQLGSSTTALYPDTGIRWNNKGTIVFKGDVVIGSNSAIVVYPKAILELGDHFISTASLHVACTVGISVGHHAILGWETTIMDSDFHPLYDMENHCFKKAYGKIHIGNFNWFAAQCMIRHSVKTPSHCTFAARSLVSRQDVFESYCVHGGSPLRILARNLILREGEEYITHYSL